MDRILFTVAEMQDAFQWAWAEITDNFNLSLIRSMPRRMAAIVAANGGHTRW